MSPITKEPITALTIILQLAILLKIKNKPPNKHKKAEVSPTDPGINPKNISETLYFAVMAASLFCAKYPNIVSPEIASTLSAPAKICSARSRASYTQTLSPLIQVG